MNRWILRGLVTAGFAGAAWALSSTAASADPTTTTEPDHPALVVTIGGGNSNGSAPLGITADLGGVGVDVSVGRPAQPSQSRPPVVAVTVTTPSTSDGGAPANVDASVTVGGGSVADIDADVTVGGGSVADVDAAVTVGGGSVADVDASVTVGNGGSVADVDAAETVGNGGSVADVDAGITLLGGLPALADVVASVDLGPVGVDASVSLGSPRIGGDSGSGSGSGSEDPDTDDPDTDGPGTDDPGTDPGAGTGAGDGGVRVPFFPGYSPVSVGSAGRTAISGSPLAGGGALPLTGAPATALALLALLMLLAGAAVYRVGARR